MLFAPRQRPSPAERLRLALWPRRSFARSARYVFWRLMRLGGSTNGLALGVAIGVFFATLPIPGGQLLGAAVTAWLLRANMPAALLGTFWANPLTMPLLWYAAYWIGAGLIGAPEALGAGDPAQRMLQLKVMLMAPGRDALSAAYAVLRPILLPIAVGAVPLAVALSFAFYWATRHLLETHRAPRQQFRSLAPRTAQRGRATSSVGL